VRFTYADWTNDQPTSIWIDPGGTYNFDRYYSRRPGEYSRMPSTTNHVLITVEQFARISNARWQVDLNPELVSIPTPDPGSVKAVGETWEQGNMSLTLTKLEIRAESESGDAAAHAWFSLVNNSNERKLIEIDYAYIYLIDSLGRRFIDWDGGGMQSQWINPGQSFDFDRYYSEMSGIRSRITRSATFVLVRSERLTPGGPVLWRSDITR
jgi:hypothetical protein